MKSKRLKIRNPKLPLLLFGDRKPHKVKEFTVTTERQIEEVSRNYALGDFGHNSALCWEGFYTVVFTENGKTEERNYQKARQHFNRRGRLIKFVFTGRIKSDEDLIPAWN